MTRLVSVHWASVFLRPTFVRQTHRQGYQALAWTVNDVPLMKLLLRLGVDGIVTDRPDLWAQVKPFPEAKGKGCR
jgi:glycerophosphoryl diester phosphodiesterase